MHSLSIMLIVRGIISKLSGLNISLYSLLCQAYLRDRTVESMGRHYAMPWPHWERESGRNVKETPLHERLDAAGASWGCVMGWERPNWFAKSENGMM